MPCPFCMIASGTPASPSPPVLTSKFGSAYPVLSTPTVIAFLDIAPIARGHVLLCPRQHSSKVIGLSPPESAAVGFWLPILSRAVMKAVHGQEGEDGSWNILQANGAEAGQTVPHTHFHIIPRAGASGTEVGKSEMTDTERKNLVLGEGPRARLEDAEGQELSQLINHEIVKEVTSLEEQGFLLSSQDNAPCMKVEGRDLKL
ncbi:HIT-like protein [Coleophoma crateriformis]|uniref:HIT-like protein n=1 Tax=Coleophoma crateriformis TaxID=565419 RepID=A0A3D8T9V5_9HELO|nr:HIT-like protein [Coleophoma crateriformis]